MSHETTSIEDLVQGFAKHIKVLKSPETKEARIRQNYIDPFWRALGWDMGDRQQLGPALADVIIENDVETAESTGLHSRAVDYLFRVNGFPRFVVEAKKPAIDIDDDKDAIFQAKRYAWNKTIPFAILTDFEQFRLYDCTLMPVHNNPTRGRIQEFCIDFGNYVSQWDVLVSTFGRAAVESGSLERLLASVKKIKSGRRIRTVDRMLIDLKGSEPVDQVFLDYLDRHRRHLAADIYRENKSEFPEASTLHGAARLTEAVQRIMDGMIFMRVCEDRGIIPYATLRDTLARVGSEGGEFFDAIVASFRDMDAKYNGYLYKDHFSRRLKVDGNVLADFTRSLYPPDGPWDFAAIGDDILGIVYERFLGNVVTVQKNHATIEEKPEVRHAGGVYYTPMFVVDTIIRRVIGPKIKDKTPAGILDIKILDPACGSGTFLVAALQYLFDYCLAAVHADPSVAKAVVPVLSKGTKGRKKKSDIAFQDKSGRWFLAPDFRAALLTRCIHGVDIDQQAVEVTVMSLYLKMLESTLPHNWQRDWIEDRLLPSLDNNIRCGNSLIDEESYFAFREKAGLNQPSLYNQENEDTKFRINRFDWISRTRGFGRLLDAQAVTERGSAGFDCIIGNPPYIRVQELNKWAPEECAFYKWKYDSAVKGSYDIYMVFAEKSLSLLAPNGLLGFIMPHKFWQNKHGDGLRKVIADGKHLRAVVDFGDQQVFQGATTYTAIHVLSEAGNANGLDVARVTELNDGVAQCSAIDAGLVPSGVARFWSTPPSDATPWHFHDAPTHMFLDNIRSGSKLLYPGIFDAVFQGIVTGADPVFLSTDWKPHSTDKSLVSFFSESDGKFVDIERGVTVPVVRRQGFESYLIEPQQLLILPYDRSNEALLSAKTLAKEFPAAWEYLQRHRTILTDRENGRFSDAWWSLSRAQNIARWSGEKILLPYMIKRLQAVYDQSGAFFVNVTTGGYGLSLRPEISKRLGKLAPLYFVGLLNSELLDYCMRRISNHFHGGYYPANKQYLQHLPIKLPTTAEDKTFADRIIDSVKVIMDAKRKLYPIASRFKLAGASDRATSSLESEIEAHEKRINEAVFALYGVDGLPAD